MESVKHFLGVCAGWLIGHTLTEDRAIVGKAESKWGNLLPEEKQIAMKNTVAELLYEMFQIEAKVISESYNGEKFGKGIYYRLVYGTDSWFSRYFLISAMAFSAPMDVAISSSSRWGAMTL